METKPENKRQFRCSCGAKVSELYITTHGEVCIDCLTEEDVARYPEFAAQWREMRKKAA